MITDGNNEDAAEANGGGHIHTAGGKRISEWHGTRLGREWKLYEGPAKEAVSLLDDESINCVVTSPPYFWLRDYGVDGQIGLEETVDGYVEALTDVMTEVHRVLKKDGVLFLNIGDTYYSGKGESTEKVQSDGSGCGQ